MRNYLLKAFIKEIQFRLPAPTLLIALPAKQSRLPVSIIRCTCKNTRLGAHKFTPRKSEFPAMIVINTTIDFVVPRYYYSCDARRISRNTCTYACRKKPIRSGRTQPFCCASSQWNDSIYIGNEPIMINYSIFDS